MTKLKSGKLDRGNDVGETGKPKACTHSNYSQNLEKRKVEDNGGFKFAVKHRKGVPKSVNKDFCYNKKYNGCEDTSFAKAINKFETKHRRTANIDDIVSIFRSLQSDEPHSEVVLYNRRLQYNHNYYSCLQHTVHTYDSEPICDKQQIFIKHTIRQKRKVIVNDLTFEDIISEHKLLMSTDKHNELIETYQKPHSSTFVKKMRDENTITKDQSLSFFAKDLQPLLCNIKNMLPNSDKYLDIIEDLVFISYLILYCDDPNILSGVLITIYKKHSGGSLTSSICKFINKLSVRDNIEKPQSCDFRKNLNKFLNMRHTVLFNKITEGLSLCIALGFIKPINVTVKNIKLFSCKASNIASDSNDFVTYVIDLLTYFFDTGYQIFQGSYERLFDMNELSKIDEDLLHLNTYINSIVLGSYEIDTQHKIEDYYARLSFTIESLKVLSNNVKDKVYKGLILNKLTNAYKLLVTFDQSRPLAGLRECPFSVSFYGSSSVGKSSSAKMVLTNLLSFNGKQCSDDFICTIQPTDKFYSTYKANVTGVIIDDICNTRSEKAVVDPAQLLISIINNIPYYAPKAESYEKGKINVRPSVVVTTTNVADMEAHIWSNEPISVVRRMKYHVTVKVRDEFVTNSGLDSSKITDKELLDLKETGLQDLWLFTINYVKRYTQSGVEKWKFETVKHNGRTMVDVSIWELTQFLNLKSREHFEEQAMFVKGCKDAGLRHKNCQLCCYPLRKCSCEQPDNSIQGGFFSYLDNWCESIGKTAANYIVRSFGLYLPNILEQTFVMPTLKLAILSYMRKNILNVVNYIPYSVRETELYRTIHYYKNRRKIYWSVGLSFFGLLTPMAYYTNWRNWWDISYTSCFCLAGATIAYRYTYSNIMNDLKIAPLHTIVPIIQQHDTVNNVVKLGIAIPVALVALKTFKALYLSLRDSVLNSLQTEELKDTFISSPDNNLEGNLNPVNYSDIVSRDKEINCWSKKTEAFVRNNNTLTMTTDQLLSRLKSNVLNITMMIDDNHGTCIGCVGLKSNVYCCPLHYFKVSKNIFGPWRPSNVLPVSESTKTLYKLKITKHDGSSGNFFMTTIDYRDIVQIGDLDLCIFTCYSGGSLPDILKYCIFPDGECNTKTIRRDREGTLHYGSALARQCPTSYTIPGPFFSKRVYNIQGGKAMYDKPTQCGDCMMIHVRDTITPSIIGFHISGLDGTNQGSFTMFSEEQINTALETLENKHKISIPHSGSILDLSRLGTTMYVDDVIPDKAPVKYVDQHNYIIRGTIDNQVSYFSEVKNTFMSSYVEKIFSTTNIWSGPKFGPQKWKPWYAFLSAGNANDNYMDSSILKLSMQDYIAPLRDKLYEYDREEHIRPLHHHEIINGIPGKRFIDHINFNSAIGYPLKGKKSKYMKGYPTNYDFNTEIFALEYDIMRDKYLNNERYYPIFKATLKDEPTKITKDKVRVFQAADITLQYAWRKYGLPILRFLSLHPLISECAVGVNPYNDEWHQLHMHLTYDGTNNDRIVAGDYKSWDVKLPAQLVLASFEIIIQLATCIPTYTKEDILIIKGLATDTTYYLSNFNGTLIEFNNGLPSGHNLTAHINSIANSLLLRYGYFSFKNPVPFRKYCHAITYGDDFECGVVKQIKHFDHVKYKSIVESLGMQLTMPDKSSDPIPFLHIDKCDFLKRRSVLCDIDDKYYGALDYSSMLRSLMVRGKSSVSGKEHAVSVLKGFLHDLSFHSREFYDVEIEKLRLLLNETNILIPQAYYNYDEYYKYKNGEMDWWEQSQEDVLVDAIGSIGYPVTPEALDSDDSSSLCVSTESDATINECKMGHGRTLTNNNKESYPGTKILDECESRSIHDDCIQSEVFGQSEDNLQNNIVQTGTAVLTSSAEHSEQGLKLISTDILSLRQHESRDLNYYLSRPTRVYSYFPDVDNTESTIEPLYIFLNRALIRDKVRNYAYMNAVIHVKIVVVGAPTMAGSHIVALHPWYKKDNGLGPLNYGDAIPNLSQLSQLPSVVTDLSREKGGEISLPILCPSNGLDITTGDQIKSAFALHYKPITVTRVPANSPLRPQIMVYVWLTDVKLTGTTTLTEFPQSDEYTIDNDSKPSSDAITVKQSVARSAGKIVGKATEIGVETALSAMGFSNPNSQDGVMPAVPRLVNNMSTYNAPCNIDSLGGDYKNEVPISTDMLGYEDPDHMKLDNILSRWTILSPITMSTGVLNGQFDSYQLPVTPMACSTTIEGGQSIFTPTALGMAALPFNRWRGAITYRFQAVGTAFMKGKIKISHEVKHPFSITEAIKSDTQVLNTVIWDLSTTNILEVKVPWASNRAFKSCGLLREGVLSINLLNALVQDFDSNGSLLINPYSILNDNGFNEISIIVSIKGEKGMMFGDMRAVLANYTFAGIDPDYNGTPQSEDFTLIPPSSVDYYLSDEYLLFLKDGRVIPINPIIWRTYYANAYLASQIGDQTPQSLVYDETLNRNILTGDNPGSILAVNINGLDDNLEDHDILTMTCMGEKWYSVRQVIKRYTQNWTRNIAPASSSDSFFRIRIPDRPVIKGWQGEASMHKQPNGVGVTYARDSFLSFYSVAFLGYRGSIRHKVCVKSSHNSSSFCDQSMIHVSRSSAGYFEGRVPIGAVTTSSDKADVGKSASAISSMPDARAGATLGYTLVNPVLEYSTPFYSSGKFCWGQDRYPQLTKLTDDGGDDYPWHQIIIYQYYAGSGYRTRVDKYVAAGDDFSLFFYLYGPRMTLLQFTGYPQ